MTIDLDFCRKSRTWFHYRRFCSTWLMLQVVDVMRNEQVLSDRIYRDSRLFALLNLDRFK